MLREREWAGQEARITRWPPPPEGPLTFVCEWPALDIPLTRVGVDSALFREAAARSRPLWDDAG